VALPLVGDHLPAGRRRPAAVGGLVLLDVQGHTAILP